MEKGWEKERRMAHRRGTGIRKGEERHAAAKGKMHGKCACCCMYVLRPTKWGEMHMHGVGAENGVRGELPWEERGGEV